MRKGRVEAFSDGVIAIIITIMVLALQPPHGVAPADLLPLLPVFLSYLLSFIFLGIYWSNHHHLFQVVERVDGRILWANLHLLFWLTLIPFGTAWIGENSEAAWPAALYGIILLCAAIAYYILVRTLTVRHGKESLLARALGNDRKEKLSVAIYAAAIALSFVDPAFSYALYVLVAALWLYPDRRIERVLP